MKNNIYKFLLLLFCVFPAGQAFAYEFDVVSSQKLPNNGKFQLISDDTNRPYDMESYPLTIVYIKTDIKDLFNKPQNEILFNKSPQSGGYLLYVDTTSGTLPVAKEGYATLTLSVKPDNTEKYYKRGNETVKTTNNGDNYYYFEIKTKGNDISKYNGRPVVTAPEADMRSLLGQKIGKPVIVVTTDLPLSEIEGKIFKKGQVSFVKESNGKYVYSVTYEYASFKEVLQPQITVYKKGTYSTAASDESLNEFIFEPNQVNNIKVIWTTKPIPQSDIKNISTYSQEMKERKTK